MARQSDVRSIEYKSTDRDLVTDADRESERWLVNAIGKRYPEHAILGEEGTGDASLLQRPGFVWVIDPLDGTVNYAHRLPIYCVSLALLRDGEIYIGAVYLPRLDELFWATAGQGAFCNDLPIRVSKTAQLSQAVIATGFPYDKHISDRDNLDNFRAVTKCVRGIRRLGAAAVDLCFTACGRLDGYWEEKINAWDIAAGMLIVKEAGGEVTNYAGHTPHLLEGHLIAANAAIREQLQILIEPYARKHKLGYAD
jgi:myo-inositol-1(or 4)-monophosphatase